MPDKLVTNDGDLIAARVAVREVLNRTPYGYWVDDDTLNDVVKKALKAVFDRRNEGK